MGRSSGALATVLVVSASLLLGVGVGFAGLLAHRHAVRSDGVALPWGLVLSLATVYAVITALAVTPGGVRSAAGCGAGWLLFVLVAQRTRPEGDYLVAGDGLGIGFVLGGMVVVAAAVVRCVARASRAPGVP